MFSVPDGDRWLWNLLFEMCQKLLPSPLSWKENTTAPGFTWKGLRGWDGCETRTCLFFKGCCYMPPAALKLIRAFNVSFICSFNWTDTVMVIIVILVVYFTFFRGAGAVSVRFTRILVAGDLWREGDWSSLEANEPWDKFNTKSLL